MKRFSICIPVWEQHGVGLLYLKDLIYSIRSQTFQNWEIIISDHSKNDLIFEYLKSLNIDFIYTKNNKNYGNGVHNLNECLKNASGEIIKIMFQDDFMFSKTCLEKFDEYFQANENKWVICGCNHTKDMITFERNMIPYWNSNILYGVNTISSPSVLAFRNENTDLFDDNLTMLMDVEYYYRLHKRYGMPSIISDILITNRQHDNQISSRYTANLNDEIEYISKKHMSI
jgi:glycosyltransferase involved in cell wall biosynthesis